MHTRTRRPPAIRPPGLDAAARACMHSAFLGICSSMQRMQHRQHASLPHASQTRSGPLLLAPDYQQPGYARVPVDPQSTATQFLGLPPGTGPANATALLFVRPCSRLNACSVFCLKSPGLLGVADKHCRTSEHACPPSLGLIFSLPRLTGFLVLPDCLTTTSSRGGMTREPRASSCEAAARDPGSQERDPEDQRGRRKEGEGAAPRACYVAALLAMLDCHWAIVGRTARALGLVKGFVGVQHLRARLTLPLRIVPRKRRDVLDSDRDVMLSGTRRSWLRS